MTVRFPGYYRSDFSNPWGTPPGVLEDEFKVLTTTSLPDALYFSGSVSAVPIEGEQLTWLISWPAVAGAASYTVVYGFSQYNVAQHTRKAGTTNTETFTFVVPRAVPQDVLVYVWVYANVGTAQQLVQTAPATVAASYAFFARENTPLEANYAGEIVDNDYMRFMIREIRRRLLTMIQNDGESFVLFFRRYDGEVCPCRRANHLVGGIDSNMGEIVDASVGVGEPPDLSADPQFDAPSRCSLCFGTGILGGYFYGINVTARYGNMPRKVIKIESNYINVENNFNTLMAWEPMLHENDLMYRPKTGEYFKVTGPQKPEWRGVLTHQQAQLELLPPRDPRTLINDSVIQAAEANHG